MMTRLNFLSLFHPIIPSKLVTLHNPFISGMPLFQLHLQPETMVSCDTNMYMDICKSQFWLRNIRKIRQCLIVTSLKQLVQSLVVSRLDYFKSLLYGLAGVLSRLQHIQNAAARLISIRFLCSLFRPSEELLHHRPIPRSTTAERNSRSLRSAMHVQLVQPQSSMKCNGDRAFVTTTPREWEPP